MLQRTEAPMRSDQCLSIIVLVALLASLLSAESAAQTTIKIGIISPTFGHAPFYVARDKGFYQAEGLTGEVIVMNRDDLILQALIAGSIQFGNISPSAVFPPRD